LLGHVTRTLDVTTDDFRTEEGILGAGQFLSIAHFCHITNARRGTALRSGERRSGDARGRDAVVLADATDTSFGRVVQMNAVSV
jgi:hypothetical protein